MKREKQTYRLSRNPVNGPDMNRRQPLLTNALPIVPEEPTFSSPLIIQGNLEAHELLAAAVKWERGLSKHPSHSLKPRVFRAHRGSPSCYKA